ncbi:MAG: hypothetical protein QM621_01410 [Aeromicrobium sp.]|uniref:hypothetical protein n=1 Tax=Aeromicrobium sp. TaxID=1871063 RepID=UPI0039E38E9D
MANQQSPQRRPLFPSDQHLDADQKASLSLAFGVLSLLCCVLGVVFSVPAIVLARQAIREGATHTGATTAIVLACLSWLFPLIALGIAVFTP